MPCFPLKFIYLICSPPNSSFTVNPLAKGPNDCEMLKLGFVNRYSIMCQSKVIVLSVELYQDKTPPLPPLPAWPAPP